MSKDQFCEPRSVTVGLMIALCVSAGSSCSASVCTQQVFEKLPVAAPAQGEAVGFSVDVLGDLALVGSPYANGVTLGDGTVRLYRREGGRWIESGVLMAPDAGILDGFGSAVAIMDATRVVIGSPRHDAFGMNAGAVYVFELDGGGRSWTLAAKLGAASAPEAKLGSAIATGDGVIAAAAPGTTICGAVACDDGAVHVFRALGGAWTLEATLTPADGAADRAFGGALALAGNRIVVGAPADDDAGIDAGAAYVFDSIAGLWIERAKLLPPFAPAATARFGSALAAHPGELLVGAPKADVGDGRVVVYSETGDRLVVQQLVEAEGAGWNLGRSVAFAGADRFFAGRGVQRIEQYQRIDGAWLRAASLAKAGTVGVADFAGIIAADCATLIAGAPLTTLGQPEFLPFAGAGLIASLIVDPCLDCNGNGLLDACDIAAGFERDSDLDGVPDRCDRRALAADLDCSGGVGGGDLGLLLGAWGPCAAASERSMLLGSCLGDLNDDGVVDGADLGILLGAWSS